MITFRFESIVFSSSLRAGLLWFLMAHPSQAAEKEKSTNQITNAAASSSLMAALPPAKWQQVENSVDRGLTWIASQQAENGSFPTLAAGQPAVTSFCVMAFLSRGHQPGTGVYGERLNRAIDFVLSCQMSNGLISLEPPGPFHEDKRPSHTAVYNHAISGLMLGEVYGQISGKRAKRAKETIERALQFSRELQTRPKQEIFDKGGWRYVRLYQAGVDSDLSVTGWQLMFLRSAKNAEFDVPQNYADEAILFVRRLWEPSSGAFSYNSQKRPGKMPAETRGMVGAGILSLAMAGRHQTPMALAAGDWLLNHRYRQFGEIISNRDRFFYGAYYCSQAMAQLGGHYWEEFFPSLVDAMLSGQKANGSWPPEVDRHGAGGTGEDSEAIFGNVYSSALAVLSLTPPYQLLPVYQR